MDEDFLRRTLLILAISGFIILQISNYFVFTNVALPLISQTGAVTNTGNITLTNSGTAGIVLLNVTIPFGSGYYNGSCGLGYAVIDSNDSSNPAENCWVNTSAFFTQPTFHLIENSGSLVINVTAYGDKQDAEELFCGSVLGCTASQTSGVLLKIIDKEGGSCTEGGLKNYTALLTHNSNLTLSICTDLGYSTNANEIYVPIRLHVPIDSSNGSKTLDITYEATAA